MTNSHPSGDDDRIPSITDMRANELGKEEEHASWQCLHPPDNHYSAELPLLMPWYRYHTMLNDTIRNWTTLYDALVTSLSSAAN